MAATHYGAEGAAADRDYAGGRPGDGLLVFAVVMLGVIGTFNVIDGIVALSKSKFFSDNATYVFSDLRTWGWIVIGLGVLQLIAASGITTGNQWARWFGIACAALNAVGQLLFIPAYPLWSISMFAADVVVIYALTAYLSPHRTG